MVRKSYPPQNKPNENQQNNKSINIKINPKAKNTYYCY